MPEDIKKGKEDQNKQQGGMGQPQQGFPKQGGGLEQERTGQGRVGSTEKQGDVGPEKKI